MWSAPPDAPGRPDPATWAVVVPGVLREAACNTLRDLLDEKTGRRATAGRASSVR